MFREMKVFSGADGSARFLSFSAAGSRKNGCCGSPAEGPEDHLRESSLRFKGGGLYQIKVQRTGLVFKED